MFQDGGGSCRGGHVGFEVGGRVGFGFGGRWCLFKLLVELDRAAGNVVFYLSGL